MKSLAVATSQPKVGSSASADFFADPPFGLPEASDIDVPRNRVQYTSKRCAALRAGDASGFTCPPRCRVACCTEEDARAQTWVKMSEHYFWQCSVSACKQSCGFDVSNFGKALVSSVFTPEIVATYLAQKKKGKKGKAGVQGSNHGSGGCARSLC